MICVNEMFEEYCKNCPEIEPVAVKSMMWANNEPYMTNIVVKCEHAKRCKAIYKHLKEGKA